MTNNSKQPSNGKMPWAIVYLLAVLLELAFILFLPDWEWLSKPLLMPALMIYFVSQAKEMTSAIRKWTLLALLFCWTGDVLLIFQSESQFFFLSGLGVFLLGHICYIFVFKRATAGGLQFSILWLVILGIYSYSVFSRLWPVLGDFKLPVSIYGVIILLMALMASARLTNKKSYYFVLFGAVFFLVSDSLIAMNKFYQPVPQASLWIMSTYMLAQWLLVQGVLYYRRKVVS